MVFKHFLSDSILGCPKKGLAELGYMPYSTRLQKRKVKQLIKAFNFRDTIRAETIFTVDPEPVFKILKKQFGYVDPEAAKLFFKKTAHNSKGDVLRDSRGTGTEQLNLQTM